MQSRCIPCLATLSLTPSPLVLTIFTVAPPYCVHCVRVLIMKCLSDVCYVLWLLSYLSSNFHMLQSSFFLSFHYTQSCSSNTLDWIFPIEQCLSVNWTFNTKHRIQYGPIRYAVLNTKMQSQSINCRRNLSTLAMLRNRLQIRADVLFFAVCCSVSLSRPFSCLWVALFPHHLTSFSFYGIRFHFLLFLSGFSTLPLTQHYLSLSVLH